MFDPRAPLAHEFSKASLSHPQKFASMSVQGGPYFYEQGTLTAKQKEIIFRETKVRAHVFLARASWQSKVVLTLTGPAKGMERATEMAKGLVNASKSNKRKSQPEETPEDDDAEQYKYFNTKLQRVCVRSSKLEDLPPFVGGLRSKAEKKAIQGWFNYQVMEVMEDQIERGAPAACRKYD